MTSLTRKDWVLLILELIGDDDSGSGVFSGAWLLGETPHWQDYAAMLLIVATMSTVLLKARPQISA